MMRLFVAFFALAAASAWPLQGATVDTNRVSFREPHWRAYRIEAPVAPLRNAPVEWLRAVSAQDTNQVLHLGRRVIVQVEREADLQALLQNRSLTVERALAPNLFVLLAPDAWKAARAAESLANQPGVHVSHPVMRRTFKRLGNYAAPPNDPYFGFDPAKPPPNISGIWKTAMRPGRCWAWI